MSNIRVIIGLGNPGRSYIYNRHNIGFRIIDELAHQLNASWSTKSNYDIATARYNDHELVLIKPLTFMNTSGQIIPALTKQGIRAENILVIHDELELPFGKVQYRLGGSHRGHNGLKSLIAALGTQDFHRLRFGIGRPADKANVPDYVLSNFTEPEAQVQSAIDAACAQALALVSPS